FKGVPDAPLRLAKYIYAATQRAARGEPVVPAELLAAPAAARRAFKGSTLELVLRALALTPATPHELDRIENLVDEIRIRSRPPKSSPRLLQARRRLRWPRADPDLVDQVLDPVQLVRRRGRER